MLNQPSLFPFLEKARGETMSLLIEARNYAAMAAERPRVPGGSVRRLMISCETMRLVSRLVSVMAWLMERKATGTDGSDPFVATIPDDDGLMTNPVCLDDTRDSDVSLPPELRTLLQRSRRLYVRIARLDAMMRGEPMLPADQDAVEPAFIRTARQ